MDTECKHFCGVAGVYGVENAASISWLMLHALQHRGQESAGIVASDGTKIRTHKDMGLLAQAIPTSKLSKLPGHVSIGHVRYSTTGSSKPQNIHPLVVEYSDGLIALAHNGNLVNARTLRDEYEAYGSIFQTSTDSEILVHLLAKPSHMLKKNSLGHCLNHIKGAYCFVFLKEDELIAARDPQGFRPLCLGSLDNGYVVASESVAFDLIGAKFIRCIEPGEMVTINKNGIKSEFFAPKEEIKPAHCVFEHIYFARPDSFIFGDNVHKVRYRLGEKIAQENPTEADIVAAIPDSGYSAAMGYAREANLPMDRAFIRNHYVGRTFLDPVQKQRIRAVNMKHNVVKEVVKGKRVILIDDSLIRGTTTTNLVHSVKEAGAKEVHLRISCPPNINPCFYGIDFPTRGELLAANHTIKEMEEMLDVDSLRYISLDGMLDCLTFDSSKFCCACFNGKYPIKVQDQMSDKFSMDRLEGADEYDDHFTISDVRKDK